MIGTVPLANDTAFSRALSSSLLQYLHLIQQTVSQNPQPAPRLQDLCACPRSRTEQLHTAQSGCGTVGRQRQNVKGTAMC